MSWQDPFELELYHGVRKGYTRKNHKYIRKENGRYIYPPSRSKLQKKKPTPMKKTGDNLSSSLGLAGKNVKKAGDTAGKMITDAVTSAYNTVTKDAAKQIANAVKKVANNIVSSPKTKKKQTTTRVGKHKYLEKKNGVYVPSKSKDSMLGKHKYIKKKK